MDGRDCAKYQNNGKRGHKWHYLKVNEEEDKIMISDHLLPSKRRQKR